MLGPEVYIEWLTGALLIGLLLTWLRREVGKRRLVAFFAAVWVGLFAASVALTAVAYVRAERAVGVGSPEERIAAFSHWVSVLQGAQLAGRVIVGLGCLAVFGYWLARGPRRGDDPGSPPDA